jgi:WD40 repeat protein
MYQSLKSHLWALRFQAVDAVGNISPYHTQLVLIMNRDSQRLIQDNAALANMSKASLKTVEYALMSENLRLQMPTRYERLLTKEETLSALLRAYYQESVAVVLPRTPGDTFITHALNSKGTQLASASENYENLKLINIETGKESWVVKSGLFISSMSFTPDDQYIVVLDSSGTMDLFDAINGAPVRTIVKETQAYALLGLNTDGSLIITDGANGIQARNLFNGELVYSIPSSVDLDKAAALSPDGRILALSSADGFLRLWDATNGQLLHAIQTQASSPFMISWSRNNKALAVLFSDKEKPDQKTVALYRLNQDNWQSGPTWTEKGARTLVLSPDGNKIFVAHDSGEVTTRSADSPERVVKVMKEQSNAVVSLFVTPDSRKLITYSEDDKIRIWNLSIIQEGRTLSLLADDRISDVIFAPDRKKIIAATTENGVVIWDIESGNILKTLVEQNADFKSKLAISQDGKTLMLKGDRDIQLWDLESGQSFRKLSLSNADTFNSAALSPNGRFVVTGMFNSRDLLIWDRTVEEPSRRLKVNTNINGVAIDPTGQLIASSGLDRAIRIWDFTTGTLLQTLDGHQTSAQHLKFSSDSLRLTSVDWYSLKVWNLSTRLPTFELKGQFQGQEFLDMNSTASRIIAGSKSGITLLDLAWENALDIPMLNFQGTLAMAEDGSSFATVLRDGQIGIWDLNHDPIRHNLCQRLQNYLAPELCSL